MPGQRLEKTKTPGIYKRGSRYVVTWRDRAGRQRRESAATLTEARDVKAKNRNQRGPTQRIRFATYAPLWLEAYRGRTGEGIGGGTLDDYARSLEQDGVPYFGRLYLDEITTGEVKRYVAHLEQRGLAPSSVAKALTVVRLVFASAVEDDDYGLPSNPALGVRVGRRRAGVDDEPVKVLEPDELERLLTALTDELSLFFDFLFETGLRISEAIEVRWSDIDLGRGRLSVSRQFYRGRLGKPKGNKTRTVRLSTRMVQELQRLRRAAADDQLVFTAERGGRLIPSNVMSRVLKPTAVKTGLGEWVVERGRRRAESWVGFHTFRHTCATQLFLRGWNAKQVSVFLGHSDPAFTLRTYIHLLPEDLPEPWGDNSVTTGATETDRNGEERERLALAV
jgi:integrase